MTRILLRGGVATEWTARNPVLAAREMGVESDTRRTKIGDGITAWRDLSYTDIEDPSLVVYDWDFRLSDTRTTTPGSVDIASLSPETLAFIEAQQVGSTLEEGQATLHGEGVHSQGLAMASGQLRLAYFVAYKTETIGRVRTISGTTAAAVGATLAQIGVFTEDDEGNLTRVGVTANDVTLWRTAVTDYTIDFTASFPSVIGTHFAVGCMISSPTTLPSLSGHNLMRGIASEAARRPRSTGVLNGLGSMPTTILATDILDTTVHPYAVLLPPL